jgi:hypothetical protein
MLAHVTLRVLMWHCVCSAGFWFPITFFASIYYTLVYRNRVAALVLAFYMMQFVLPKGKVRYPTRDPLTCAT